MPLTTVCSEMSAEQPWVEQPWTVAPTSATSAGTAVGAVCAGRSGVSTNEGVTGAVTILSRVLGLLMLSGHEGYRRCPA
jgi:hypothetical protein